MGRYLVENLLEKPRLKLVLWCGDVQCTPFARLARSIL
jgi:hypothetical protein